MNIQKIKQKKTRDNGVIVVDEKNHERKGAPVKKQIKRLGYEYNPESLETEQLRNVKEQHINQKTQQN